jgi:hypothetical protein
MKYVQSYKVVIKQAANVKGTYIVSNGNDSFTIPADYPRGNYRAYVYAQEGYREDIPATLPFTIH